MEPLDNIMWHALSGPQLRFAQGDDRARCYPSDVAAFSAVPDEPRPEHFAALRDLVGPDGVAVLFRDNVEAPDDWDVLDMFDGVQMVAPTSMPSTSLDPRVVTLGALDVEDMMSLTSRTNPGPFARRTFELGTYLGIRHEGHLIAMAGQRARTNEHIEISAVCTDAAFVGQGLGRALVIAQVATIIAEEKIPMLHASAQNLRAIALYDFLGFQLRRTVKGIIMRSPH